MSSLEKRPDEPFDVESKWLFQQLDKENRVSLVIAGAALDGYCTPSCPKRYAVAKAAVAIALSERSRAEDRSFRWGDRWFGLLYAVIAAIATLVSTGAIIVFSRAESRTEKAIHALVQQLSSGAGDVQQGTPADRKTAARFPVG